MLPLFGGGLAKRRLRQQRMAGIESRGWLRCNPDAAAKTSEPELPGARGRGTGTASRGEVTGPAGSTERYTHTKLWHAPASPHAALPGSSPPPSSAGCPLPEHASPFRPTKWRGKASRRDTQPARTRKRTPSRYTPGASAPACCASSDTSVACTVTTIPAPVGGYTEV
jgi:hypothetical protein